MEEEEVNIGAVIIAAAEDIVSLLYVCK